VPFKIVDVPFLTATLFAVNVMAQPLSHIPQKVVNVEPSQVVYGLA
jgi:hypothetical protein